MLVENLYKLYKKNIKDSLILSNELKLVLDIRPTIKCGVLMHVENYIDACLLQNFLQDFREEKRIVNLKK